MLETDASNRAIGAVLLQDGRPVAYESKKLDRAQQNYSAYERELYAIIHALKKCLTTECIDIGCGIFRWCGTLNDS